MADADADEEIVGKPVKLVPESTEDPDAERDEAEVVAVAAINASGSNVYELADGFAEERERYNELRDLILMFVRVSWAEDQHILICPKFWVHTSLDE